MITSPARTVSPNAARWVATCATTRAGSPVSAYGSSTTRGSAAPSRISARRPSPMPASAGPSTTWRWKMSPARTSSTSEASPRSTSSNAAPRPPIAAAAVARSAPPGTSRRDVDRHLRLRHRPAPVGDRAGRSGLEQATVGEEADQRRRGPELLHRRGRAEAELPADRAGAVVEQPAAQLELPSHPTLHARVFVQGCHARIMARLESVRSPGYLLEHMFDRPEEPQAAWTSART